MVRNENNEPLYAFLCPDATENRMNFAPMKEEVFIDVRI